ncbi:MFS transporter [Vitreoscilla massiliensis]|uniref:MFS transporter n=1 Tax=Vitreoscilla massiliensis TaxID=1689272 RepID=A0ABY4DZK0_9NEIS|nr:MFS transporter [Vitreoscilla massiliensis]UOO88536.1 MFS transporter [Vitreoscilla massiliensis]
MKSTMALSSLFTAVALVFTGVGLFIFFSNIELTNAGVSSEKIGLINAGFYLGALLSGIIAQRWVAKVGHIRAFALFTAFITICMLLHVVVKQEIALIVIRVILGFSDYSLLMVVESWLNARSSNKNRSSILAVYTMIFYMAFMLASVVIATPIASATMYALCAILAAASIIPIMLTRIEQPQLPQKMGISFPKLWEVVPLALLGSITAGFLVGGFITMAPVYVALRGLDNQVASHFILAAMCAGLVVQIPMGKFSYAFGRRSGIILACSFALTAALLMWLLGQFPWVLVGSAFLMGCGVFTMYSLSSARANDSIPPHSNVVEIGRSMLFSYCIGSFLSPLVLGFLMKYLGANGFTLQYVVLAGLLLAFALTQAVIPRPKRGPYVSMPVKSGVGGVLLDESMQTDEADGAANVANTTPESEMLADVPVSTAEAVKANTADLQAASASGVTEPAAINTTSNVLSTAAHTETLEVVQAQTQQDLAIQDAPHPQRETSAK